MFQRYTAIAALLLCCTTCLLAQGLNTRATKNDWEEINFEFNSSILSDGYPSLLRLAELLQTHPDYRVHIEGHTDFVGSEQYNDRLALARANTVRDFLVKYGARANQIQTSGRGKRNPEVDNRTPEGRFMNRRVVLTVTNGQGQQVSDGGVAEAIQAMTPPAKPAPDCCSDILKRLDDIMAMLRDLKNENDDLRKQVAALKAQPAPPPAPALPPPVSKEELSNLASEAAKQAVEAGRTRRFSLLGLNAGPDTNGNTTFTGKGRFFAPFSNDSPHAVQIEGEYLYFRDRQEGQFDAGLVNRYKSFQAGLFSSFKHVSFRNFQSGGTLGEGALTLDYVFGRGRVGAFGTKGFLNNAVVNETPLGNSLIQQTYLRIVDQVGFSTQVGLWRSAYVEGNLGALFQRGAENRPGGTLRFVQPINRFWAFTVEAGLNETLAGKDNTGRVVFGIQLGNWLRPREYAEVRHPVPVDIPRLRYEVLTRTVRSGNDPPVADAGPDQINVPPGTITLDGSGSYDPNGDPITYQWTQTFGPPVTLSNPTSAKTTFQADAGKQYSFRLTVADNHGGTGTAKVTVTTRNLAQAQIVKFTADPPQITAGQTSTLIWQVEGADRVTITPGIGQVDSKAGTISVAPTATTIYTLTAQNSSGEVTQTATVTVIRPDARIVSFQATPTNIQPGGAATLSWQTENADQVSISGIGNVAKNGSTIVSPNQTTTYTLTAQNRFGSVNATVTVTVGAPGVPRILQFSASPTAVLPGGQATLVWQVENATSVTITGIGSVQPTGTSTVSPTTDTTYTLTASNGQGQVSATAVVTVIQAVKILNFTANPPAFQKPGDPITLSWQTSNATQVIITGVGSVPVNGSVTVNPTVATSYSLIAYGRRSQVTAIVVVNPANGGAGGTGRAPVANPGQDRRVQSATVLLDGSGSYDPEGGSLTFSWTASGSKLVRIDNANSARATATLLSGPDPYTGEYDFQLTVTNSKGVSTTVPLRIYYIP